ncbi:MAG: FHA domain-containing protein [Deltaproteobacteria bacterium]|nr:MAG: FHA domain-containing protein [Deltaproteobacteria bacterium]
MSGRSNTMIGVANSPIAREGSTIARLYVQNRPAVSPVSPGGRTVSQCERQSRRQPDACGHGEIPAATGEGSATWGGRPQGTIGAWRDRVHGRLQDLASGDDTITSISLGRTGEPDTAAQPCLVVLAISDDLNAPSSRHLLGGIDEVRFGRGPRSATRVTAGATRVLELRIPDPWMSSDHGRLLRGPVGWVLDDPRSKNGAVVNAQVTRQTIVGDGALIELGHSFLLFCEQPIEHGATDDLVDGEIDVPAPALKTFVGPLATGFAALDRLARTPVSIVLLGETGTGKEVLARALHALSGRPGAFIAVNCGALPAALIEAELFGHRRGAFTGAVGDRVGLIRSAEGGTLFLDEIGELPPASQAAFLRVLQEREVVPVGDDRPVKVDVRLCAATHRDLAELVERGAFREDLFGRISGFTLGLPPLAQRRADFGLLLRALLAGIPGASAIRFAPPALRALLAHAWPLNIRALEKTLLTAVTLEGVIQPSHLVELMRRPPAPDEPEAPTPVSPSPRPIAARDANDEALRERLIGLLTVHRGNVVAVSRVIGTRRTQIYRWARRLGIELDGFRK